MFWLYRLGGTQKNCKCICLAARLRHITLKKAANRAFSNLRDDNALKAKHGVFVILSSFFFTNSTYFPGVTLISQQVLFKSDAGMTPIPSDEITFDDLWGV